MIDAGMNGIVERFVTFDCERANCLGVISEPWPGASRSDLGVLIIVGGPQYRVGSHRQFTLAARAFAAAGMPTLRFDYRGMGDSEGASRSFTDIDEDIAAAASALRREAGVRGVVLWGLCDGASAALMHAGEAADIEGIVALNPWARTSVTQATTRLRHYYVQRLFSRNFWTRLLRGRVNVGDSLAEVAQAVGAASARGGAAGAGFLDRMGRGWASFGRPVLVVLSGRDFTAREFEAWVAADAGLRALLARPASTVLRIPEADHTFSTGDVQDRLRRETIAWLKNTVAGS